MIGKTVWIVVYIPDWDNYKTKIDSVHATMEEAEKRKDWLNLNEAKYHNAQTLCYKIVA